jgi:mono/diheme cytochrome c family protein
MSKSIPSFLPGGAALLALSFALAAGAAAQMHHHDAPPQATAPAGPRRITMEELHRLGGVPRGWKFTLPDGDAARGKQVFADAGCYKCHAVQGADFPDAGAEKKPGPELTGMGGHHPAEYLAESIISPNDVILDGPGYAGPDGLSIMPSYADSLSVRQLLDVVAYLRSQTEKTGGHDHMMMMGHDHEATAGDYTIRLTYQEPTGNAKTGHVLVFISDKNTREAVPYLPVSLTIKTEGKKPRTVTLVPTASAEGFHYGADVTIPDEADAVSVSIGRTTMKMMGSARSRYAKPVTARFEW